MTYKILIMEEIEAINILHWNMKERSPCLQVLKV